MTLTSQQLVRLLASDDRRRVVAALVLAEQPLSASDLAAQSGLEVRAMVDAADRLVGPGLVRLSDGTYELDESLFQQAARTEAGPAPASAYPDQPDDVARVLDTAFADGKLVQWPAKHSKRLIVLDYLCQQFDIGKRYKEAEVNDLLRPFNDDVATSRRYLVEWQFLDRSGGQYWRCGGTI